jgi:hypothetical protein
MNEPDELSVLDYFAAAALTGLLANDSDQLAQTDAKDAYTVAEAMMLERAKRDKDGNKLEANG